MTGEPIPLFVTIGSNPVRMFGLDARARACRLAVNAGFECADAPPPGRPVLLANLEFAWDPAWLGELARRPDTALIKDGLPVLAHATNPSAAETAASAMRSKEALNDGDFDLLDADSAQISYFELRKRERPFVLPLHQGGAEAAERAAYDGAYKGVTDFLTLYLWRNPAFHLTRWAARAGMHPNMVTAIGALLCVLAFWLFWNGSYWPGVAAGFVFMVLDTVDGKLARCTGTSSKWGNFFDHGIDLVHPPFWWWAWAHGLAAYDRPLEPVYQTMLLWAIIGGYVAQRAIEGVFLKRFAMHIHVWRPVDSRFRLVTARRNPNMAILVACLLFARPDVGLELLALWTLVSLIFHTVRLAQANARADRGRKIMSWLA